jgi:hypothetical protein
VDRPYSSEVGLPGLIDVSAVVAFPFRWPEGGGWAGLLDA